jgi:ribosomal protein S18 acetylase RimI-like enzyme
LNQPLTLDIRRATADDAGRVLQLWIDSGASMRAIDDFEAVRAVLHHPAATLLVATVNDDIIGTLLGTFDGWRGHVYRLVVHPHHRRCGIGRRLVHGMEQILKSAGAKRVIALVEADRAWAMQFWQAVGYPRDDHDLVYVGTLD